MGLFSAIKNYIITTCQHVLHPRIHSIKPAALAIQDLEYLDVHEQLALPGNDPPLVNSSQNCDQSHQHVLRLDPPAFAKAYLKDSPALNCSGENLIIPGIQNLAVPIHRYSNGGAELDPARPRHDRTPDVDSLQGQETPLVTPYRSDVDSAEPAAMISTRAALSSRLGANQSSLDNRKTANLTVGLPDLLPTTANITVGLPGLLPTTANNNSDFFRGIEQHILTASYNQAAIPGSTL